MLDGKVAVMTGAGQGLGLAYARAFSAAGALWKMTDEDFDAVISVHLRGTFTCVRAAAMRMREQGTGGRIICIGSPTGQVGSIGQTNYAAAKAGIVGMVRTWALELARASITVNAVIPVAATGMTETVPFLREYADVWQSRFAGHLQPVGQHFPEPY
jgi:NAD(P)-dependent dehydrogenase (short-subunit alcohol dehydrogenase family)